MPWNEPSSLHVSKLLTNVGHRWKNPQYIGSDIFPIVKVGNKSDYYQTWYKGVWFRDEALPIAPGAPVPYVQPDVKTDNSYTCITYGIGTPISAELKANADSGLQYVARATELLQDKIMLARELRMKTAINTSGNWTSSLDVSGTVEWDVYATSDPIGQIDTAMDTVEDNSAGLRANTMVMGKEVWRVLRRHPEIIRLCFGEGSDTSVIVTPQKLAQAFELDRVLVGRSVYINDQEQASGTDTATMTNIWGDYCWIGHVTRAPSIQTPSAGYIFQWNYKVRAWFSDESDSDKIAIKSSEDEVVTAKDCGYLLYDLIT